MTVAKPGAVSKICPTEFFSCVCWRMRWDYNGNAGTVVLLTGDGAGYSEGQGFHSTLARMHTRGWKVEVLSWLQSCNRGMRSWAEQNGIFVPLDDFYDAITFREPSREGHEFASRRDATPLDLTSREMA